MPDQPNIVRSCLFALAMMGILADLSIGAESVATQIDTRIAAFETQMDRSFAPIKQTLEQWRERQRREARRTLQDLLKSADPADRVYVAFHVLADDPKYRPARDLFTTSV
jgi:predicted GNAT superfamily acetyltransferase